MSCDPPKPTSGTISILDVNTRHGRNDPCPCGSGKKFKNCHIGTAGKVREFQVYVANQARMQKRHPKDVLNDMDEAMRRRVEESTK